MEAITITIHIIVCIALIMIVLLQTGKGADMGAAFGGGASQTLFGSSGASTFLSKATTIAAVVFMLTCFTLAYMSTHQTPKSIMQETKVPAAKEEALPETQETKAPAAQAQDTAASVAQEASAPVEQSAPENTPQSTPERVPAETNK